VTAVIEVLVSSMIFDVVAGRAETSLCVRPILAIEMDGLLLMALPETEHRNAALVVYSPMTCSFITTQNYDTVKTRTIGPCAMSDSPKFPPQGL